MLADGRCRPPGRFRVRPARQRAAVRSPQRRRPPRRETGEHPDRPRRQRVPHRLRHGVRARRRESAIAAANSSIGASLDAPYASPEQLAGRPMSPASDVYSLAVVAARALTGLTGDYEAIRGALPVHRPHRARPRHRPTTRFAATRARRLRSSLDRGARRRSHRRCSTMPRSRTPTRGCGRSAAADAADFFGRERLVERLIARLGRAGHSVGGSWPSSGRAAAASPASSGPGSCRRWRPARCRCRRTGSGSR